MQNEASAIDTNEEYIVPVNVKKEPAILGSVFRAIIVETVRDFFGGILGFFLKYIRHFIDGFRYFWSPSLHRKPFDEKDYKQNCQHSFELAMLVLVSILFMVKLGWIPPTSSTQLEAYNNDLLQMFFQFMFFLFFAVCYLVMALLSILTGRLLRKIFVPPISRRESDILFIYLNNACFSIAAIVALWARCSASAETTSTEEISAIVFTIFLLLFLPVLILWSVRFSILNRIPGFKKAGFILVSVVLLTTFYCLSGALITMLQMGV
jgi:hypothetical protein